MNIKIVYLLFIIISFIHCGNITKNDKGYEGDLIPLKDEIANIDNYKKATERLIERLPYLYPNVKYDNLEMANLQSYFIDSLNLRFYVVYRGDIVNEGDTLIRFEASSPDYYMRSHNGYPYILFRHSIIYTNQKVDTVKSEYVDIEKEITPYAKYHLEGQYYYEIRSYMEY